MIREEVVVVIVGAGPSGLATAACLNQFSIPNIVLEREDCCGSLWKKRSYDRLHLHLAKQFCSLPLMPHPRSCPTYMPKANFIQYLDDYAFTFNVNPRYYRSVESAFFDKVDQKWHIEAKSTISGDTELYISMFLVVATGENAEGYIPPLLGLETFDGEILHSREYKSGSIYKDKDVLVVGCGNSGMEIAFDLANFGAHASIVVRSPIHIVSKEMIYIGMILLKYVPIFVVDLLLMWLSKLKYGEFSMYGICKPKEGVFYAKATKGKSPVIDVGTVKKIKAGAIKVLPGISTIKKNNVVFENGCELKFDAIIFATGYRVVQDKWLIDYKNVLDSHGMPKKDTFPTPWKARNGLYFVGLSRNGLPGISADAKAIADDIKNALGGREWKPL